MKASELASRGFAIFPVAWPVDGNCSCLSYKESCDSPAKHPIMKGWRDHSSSDIETIRDWGRRWPGANIGIDCGKSDIVVLDVDERHGGDETLRDLENEHRPLPDTVSAVTQSGGAHYYFRCPEGVTLHNSAGALGRGLDIRAQGGFVVAPPSRGLDGQYAWEVEPGELEMSEPPEWLVQTTANRTQSLKTIPDIIPVGARDQTLTSLAGSMRRRGAPTTAILAALRETNQQCEKPLNDCDLQRIAESVARYDPAAAKGYRRLGGYAV